MPTLRARRFRPTVLLFATFLAMMTAIAGLSGPGHAQSSSVADRHSFSVSLHGLRAATLSFTGAQSGNAYNVTGKLESKGLAAMVRKVRYDANVRGRTKGGKYRPSAYSEKAHPAHHPHLGCR